ncbi:hypothetical protein [Actinomadura fibrosa]|uniref:Uncharacterized protein n=1 Tax=Actinomadura fibrosa TaxID=111802 RepID=A0ABW2XI51_9ACTN
MKGQHHLHCNRGGPSGDPRRRGPLDPEPFVSMIEAMPLPPVPGEEPDHPDPVADAAADPAPGEGGSGEGGTTVPPADGQGLPEPDADGLSAAEPDTDGRDAEGHGTDGGHGLPDTVQAIIDRLFGVGLGLHGVLAFPEVNGSTRAADQLKASVEDLDRAIKNLWLIVPDAPEAAPPDDPLPDQDRPVQQRPAQERPAQDRVAQDRPVRDVGAPGGQQQGRGSPDPVPPRRPSPEVLVPSRRSRAITAGERAAQAGARAAELARRLSEGLGGDGRPATPPGASTHRVKEAKRHYHASLLRSATAHDQMARLYDEKVRLGFGDLSDGLAKADRHRSSAVWCRTTAQQIRF